MLTPFSRESLGRSLADVIPTTRSSADVILVTKSSTDIILGTKLTLSSQAVICGTSSSGGVYLAHSRILIIFSDLAHVSNITSRDMSISRDILFSIFFFCLTLANLN